MPQSSSDPAPVRSFKISFAIHFLLLVSGISALFFLLTNGIPLVQLGVDGGPGEEEPVSPADAYFGAGVRGSDVPCLVEVPGGF